MMWSPYYWLGVLIGAACGFAAMRTMRRQRRAKRCDCGYPSCDQRRWEALCYKYAPSCVHNYAALLGPDGHPSSARCSRCGAPWCEVRR